MTPQCCPSLSFSTYLYPAQPFLPHNDDANESHNKGGRNSEARPTRASRPPPPTRLPLPATSYLTRSPLRFDGFFPPLVAFFDDTAAVPSAGSSFPPPRPLLPSFPPAPALHPFTPPPTARHDAASAAETAPALASRPRCGIRPPDPPAPARWPRPAVRSCPSPSPHS